MTKKIKQKAKKNKEITSKKVSKTPVKAKQKTGKKKERLDSPKVMLDMAQAAFREISPPEYIFLQDGELRYFDSIIAEFAKIEWTDHTIEVAAFLAQNMAGLAKEQAAMSKEGGIIDDVKIVPGTPPSVDKNGKKIARVKTKRILLGVKINPRKALIDSYIKNVIALRRSLSLHARMKDGEPRDAAKRRAAAKNIENALTADDDDLLAKPKTLQ